MYRAAGGRPLHYFDYFRKLAARATPNTTPASRIFVDGFSSAVVNPERTNRSTRNRWTLGCERIACGQRGGAGIDAIADIFEPLARNNKGVNGR